MHRKNRLWAPEQLSLPYRADLRAHLREGLGQFGG
jgi:hypothetical protein